MDHTHIVDSIYFFSLSYHYDFKQFKHCEAWCLLFLFRLEEYSVETAIAMVVDGDAKLKINTEHLREISFRIGSTYQFIGELLIQPDNQVNY